MRIEPRFMLYLSDLRGTGRWAKPSAHNPAPLEVATAQVKFGAA